MASRNTYILLFFFLNSNFAADESDASMSWADEVIELVKDEADCSDFLPGL